MPRLSTRTKDLHASPVREMLNVSQRPGIISFAGGLPAPETFAGLDLPAPPPELLQYGPSEGEPALRARIAADLAALGLDCSAERVLILSGSQQGIDLAAKLIVDPGSTVGVESPAYLAALQVFRYYGADLHGLDRSKAVPWRERTPAMAYVTPTFRNPSGECWNREERRAFAAACDRNDVLLFEDDPYRDLVYDPCERRPICASIRRASWIYQGSFSKTIAPGLRLGFLTASEDIFPYLVRLKQAADLHTNRLSQWMVLHYLEDEGREARLAGVAALYRRKRDSFAAALDRHLGGFAAWSLPPGGLFFWVTLPDRVDTGALLKAAVAKRVLFTPGEYFRLDERAAPAMRLNFSLADSEAAERGLAILGALVRESLDRPPAAPVASRASTATA